jgi:signal transduction histidine kinase
MIADLLAHARSTRQAALTHVDLGRAVREHAAAWAALYARSGRTIRVRGDHHASALASPGTIGQVIDVLLDNALRHGEGTSTIATTHDGRFATISVEDEGPGVDPAAADTIFERGATNGTSTGIGLHLARTLARGDGGSLRLAPGTLTRFELRLRRVES